jgi:hypothetical protein
MDKDAFVRLLRGMLPHIYVNAEEGALLRILNGMKAADTTDPENHTRIEVFNSERGLVPLREYLAQGVRPPVRLVPVRFRKFFLSLPQSDDFRRIYIILDGDRWLQDPEAHRHIRDKASRRTLDPCDTHTLVFVGSSKGIPEDLADIVHVVPERFVEDLESIQTHLDTLDKMFQEMAPQSNSSTAQVQGMKYNAPGIANELVGLSLTQIDGVIAQCILDCAKSTALVQILPVELVRFHRYRLFRAQAPRPTPPPCTELDSMGRCSPAPC